MADILPSRSLENPNYNIGILEHAKREVNRDRKKKPVDSALLLTGIRMRWTPQQTEMQLGLP
jgi:hypothetical protein